MLKIENIEYSRQFLKHLSHLPAHLVDRAEARERIFKENSFDPRLRTHKLHGKDKGAWGFWIDHKYRIKFIFTSETRVLFFDVGTHDIYT